ncbi:MAG TPA: hypothetical protein VGR06_29595 [Actinophytocola sp.]|uniref:hypothetical protein n=1 Tax=Actinophytocola sp. TaxID=1872138 RepID=UPI002E02F8AF|nr:hypothetical protein [Actinophytocola sp.]
MTTYSPGYRRCRSTVSATVQGRILLLASLPVPLVGAVTDQTVAESHGEGRPAASVHLGAAASIVPSRDR